MYLLLYIQMFFSLFLGSLRTRSQSGRNRRVALNTFTDAQTTGTVNLSVGSSELLVW